MGYTRSTTGGRLWRTVHPHSRGVYGMVRSRGGGSTAVHPHSRGVYKTTGLELIDDCGSSPLAWGIRLPRVCALVRGRFIPTRVGYTLTPAMNQYGVNGSSPLAWGIQAQGYCREAAQRFIPTRVGYTFISPITALIGAGSSPLAWGIHSKANKSIKANAVHPHSRVVYTVKQIKA